MRVTWPKLDMIDIQRLFLRVYLASLRLRLVVSSPLQSPASKVPVIPLLWYKFLRLAINHCLAIFDAYSIFNKLNNIRVLINWHHRSYQGSAQTWEEKDNQASETTIPLIALRISLLDPAIRQEVRVEERSCPDHGPLGSYAPGGRCRSDNLEFLRLSIHVLVVVLMCSMWVPE
jgi:hypothetical protein